MTEAEVPFSNDGSFLEMFLGHTREADTVPPQPEATLAGSSGGSISRPSTGETPPFMPSPSFQGPVPGYAFKTDAQGTGYYVDVGLDVMLNNKKQEIKAKPMVIRSNNPIVKRLPVTRQSDELPQELSKKQKTAAAGSNPEQGSKPHYLKEMERYRSLACDSDSRKDRPLVK